MKQGLIVVDVQNDYFTGGTMELVAMSAAASNCRRLLDSFRKKQAPVFHVQHIAAEAGATFFVPNTQGCEIHESVKPLENEPVVIKHYPSAFRETGLNDMLKKAGVDEVVICGAMTHMCIDTTTRAAFDLGFKCRVISDACATRELAFDGQVVKAADVQAAFMAALGMAFAQVMSTEKYLATA